MDRQLLARATDNSDAPTPGYMYNDIAKNAAASPGVCSEVGRYLTGRLASKNSHNVKYKCLKVIAKTAASPYLSYRLRVVGSVRTPLIVLIRLNASSAFGCLFLSGCKRTASLRNPFKISVFDASRLISRIE